MDERSGIVKQDEKALEAAVTAKDQVVKMITNLRAVAPRGGNEGDQVWDALGSLSQAEQYLDSAIAELKHLV